MFYLIRDAHAHLLKGFLALSLLLTLSVYSNLAHSEELEVVNNWYQVDFILFEHTKPEKRVLRYETLGEAKAISEESKQFYLRPYDGEPPARRSIIRLPDDQKNLLSATKRIEKHDNTELLLEGAWKQELEIDKAPKVIHIKQENDRTRLWGTISLWRSRYTHIEVDLYTSERVAFPLGSLADWLIDSNSEAYSLEEILRPIPKSDLGKWRDKGLVDFNVYRINQKRRIRNGEVHYLDHPMMGVIASIKPLETAP